jgi:hypothetical protein
LALALLLDENITYVVAEQVKLKRPDVRIASVHSWRGGSFKGESDRRLLRAAAQDELTLVTYDRRTIPPLLAEWGVTGEDHHGVIFVDHLTIRRDDVGGLVRALIQHWDKNSAMDWTNVIDFLRAAPGAI